MSDKKVEDVEKKETANFEEKSQNDNNSVSNSSNKKEVAKEDNISNASNATSKNNSMVPSDKKMDNDKLEIKTGVKKEDFESNSFTKGRDYKEPELVVDEFLLKNRDVDYEKSKIRKSLGMQSSIRKEEKLNFYRRLKLRLYKAGIEIEPELYVKKVMLVAVIVTSLVAIGLGVWGFISNINIFLTILLFLGSWFLGFFVFNYLFLLLSFAYLNYVAFLRMKEVERLLPEFLRLVATNYRSGLPLDKALIASNRARFGILSKEIEQVAKTTRVKGDLAKALEIFGKKFESKILERAMNSISVSIKSGSNISELLDEIANNITKMRNMQASMAANVKNYVIFIVIAGVVIAPLMFAMSYQMNHTISEVKGRLEMQTDVSSATSSPISVGEGGGVNPDNFDVFAILMILTNCIISSMIISMIKQGNFQQGFKNIFLFTILSLILYFVGKMVLSGIIGVV